METFSALLAICAGNSPVPGEFPAQRPGTRSFDVFFDLCQNKWLSKQSSGWWFDRAHCDVILMQCYKEVGNLLATSLLADSFVFSYSRRLMVLEYEYADYPREVSGHLAGHGWMPTLYPPKVGLPRHRSHRDSMYFCQYVLFFFLVWVVLMVLVVNCFGIQLTRDVVMSHATSAALVTHKRIDNYAV